MSSSIRSEILNLFCDLCRGLPALPLAISRLKYKDYWIPNLLAHQGQGRDDSGPTFVLASHAFCHTMIVITTEESRFEDHLLDSCAKMTAATLRERALLSREQTETYDIVLFGWTEYRDTLRQQIQELGCTFPLVLRTSEGLALDQNQFSQAVLTHAFRPFLPVDWGRVTRGWHSCVPEATLAEAAEVVIPEVVAHLAGGRRSVTVAEICEAQTLWQLLGQPQRDEMRKLIRDVLQQAATREFREYFQFHGGRLSVGGGPEGYSKLFHPQTLKKLARTHSRFLQRLADVQMTLPLLDSPFLSAGVMEGQGADEVAGSAGTME